MNLLRRRRESGQSIPLIALMIVLLFAMVGLSVDVGNTYAEQRTVTRGTNAAAIAGMDFLVKGYSDEAIGQSIRESLKSNGVKLDTDDGSPRTLQANYLNVEGKVISNCNIGECTTVNITEAQYIQVNVKGTVSTYFARVVGRPSLPVDSTSWAGRCPPINGVYPLAVWHTTVDEINGVMRAPTPAELHKGNSLDKEFGTYSDGVYKNKFWRRIWLKDSGTAMGAGSFSLLRWNANDSSSDVPGLAAAFTGAGTLASTFKEVTPQPPSDTPQLAGYPFSPGQLTIGDWIAAAPGAKFQSNDVGAALKKLQTERTTLILPIISSETAINNANGNGGGTNTAVKLKSFGKFYIGNPDGNGGMSQQGGANAYIDLVYLGPANDMPCLVTNVDPVDGTTTPPPPGTTTPPPGIEVTIPFQVNPRWQTESEPADPIAYQLVIDVSGSMVWDFYGNGTLGGTIKANANTSGGTNYRCEWSAPETQYTYRENCSGPTSPWWNYKERRIYTTKDAIRTFIGGLGANDTMRYTAFSSGRGYSGNALVVPSSGYTNNKATLLSELDTLGSYNNDPYITNGGTPGPQALQMARTVLSTAPSVAPNGQKYRDVIIYLTDGVANVFLSGTTNYATDICPQSAGWSPNKAQNTPDPCQIGYSASAGQNRPITEMVNQANLLKEANKESQIYVIALATVATDGLSQVASAPSMLYKANEPGFVGSVMEAIRKRVNNTNCISNGGSRYYDRIDASHHSDLSGSYALTSEQFGKVKIYNDNGTSVIAEVPITHDAASGKLGIKTNLPPGNYQMAAWIGYKGGDEPTPISRIYQALSWNKISFSNKLSFAVVKDSSLNSSIILPTVYVDLESNQNVCPVK
ncbi:hypothetical protein F8S13_23830 [Chloroflexia bacterium SDU3-3]|nr:hypothetical protein F8S13_23830 [Chloroflexia bacterium SDU3-3]